MSWITKNAIAFFNNSIIGDKKNIIMNRDFNGSMNIRKKGKLIMRNKRLPEYLCRAEGSEKKIQ